MKRVYFCNGCDRRIPERDCKDGMRCECGETKVRLLPKCKASWTSRPAKSVEVSSSGVRQGLMMAAALPNVSESARLLMMDLLVIHDESSSCGAPANPEHPTLNRCELAKNHDGDHVAHGAVAEYRWSK